jgi:hypothetical protein
MDKKKICFISLGNLYLCPYISKYISLINCDYDVIYWDRHEIDEGIGAKQIFPFRYKMSEGTGTLNKASGYLKFRKYAIEILKKNNYDRIILLQTNVAILLQTILKKRYKHKYIIDVRDYTMEKNLIYYFLLKSLINSCAYTIISSRGYKKFLPKFNYIIVHNDSKIDDITIKKFENRIRTKDRIVISYIGLIRFHEQNKKIILKLKNDNRFLLRFIGTDAFTLKGFCENNQVNNVELIDRFPPEKTLDYYYETDIIYNLYGNKKPNLDYALSNKLYYAAKLKMPILVSPNTYMEKISKYNGFGFVFDINDPNACDNLFDYYQAINWHKFSKNCDEFIMNVDRENFEFNCIVRKFVEQI